MAQYCDSTRKGLSFIDWEALSEEEYIKLNRIINTPCSHSALQLPFSAENQTTNAGPPLMAADPIYPPIIPAPPVVGFPIPVHWSPGDQTMCPQPPAAAAYPITVPGAYIFPSPALASSGETTMAFVSTLSVQPMYTIPGMTGHQIPHPDFQIPPLLHHKPLDLSLPARRSGTTADLQFHHTDPVTPAPENDYTTAAGLSQAGAGLAPVNSHLCHPGLPPPQQVQYISQVNMAPTLLPASRTVSSSSSFDQNSQSNDPFTSQSVAIVGLPPVERPSSIEFGGPVVFNDALNVNNGSQIQSNIKVKSLPGEHLNPQVVIDMDDLSISPRAESRCVNRPDPGSTSSGQTTQPVGIEPTNQVSTADQPKHMVNGDILNHSDEVTDYSAPGSTMKASPPLPAKTWSSLFMNKGSSNAVVHGLGADTGKAVVPNALLKEEVKSVRYWQEHEKTESKVNFVIDKLAPVDVQKDPLAIKILELLFRVTIIHTPIVIQPRGLVNGSNTCFMNATLQVLMGCPPFVHMFRVFKNMPSRPGGLSATPIFDSLVHFVNSFQNGQRIRNQGSRGKKSAIVDINVGQPLNPIPLLNVAQSRLGLNIGVQHDAEEFLSQILMICHEELENVMKLQHSSGNNEHQQARLVDNPVADDDDSWLKVGPKNHHVETNVNDCGKTPLSSIFAGLSRSCLVRESGKTSDTVDSFFTLKLDIQAESVHNLTDAILRLNSPENVTDADGGKVQGQRRMFFDVLPPVLIMHLKLFQYSNGNGQKIQKKIDFGVDLVIPKETLSKVGRVKLASVKTRSYKLFGVVNHHGAKMTDGHYTSDVYLPVASGWLHFDDCDVVHISEAQVLEYSDRRMPYLLFYRRMDS